MTFTLGNGSDADAGLDVSSATVTRETGDLAGDSCSNFTADAGTFTSPDTSVSGGHCYRYTFTISDRVGNTSTGVTATAKVDTDNPSVTLTDPGTPLAGTVALDASASDPTSAVQQVVFQRAPAGGSTWTTIGTDTSAPYAASWNTGGVADGDYDLRAVVTDLVGNSDTDTVASRRVDNTAPNTTIDSSPADPSNDATPTFGFSSTETGSTFECRVDGGSWTACTTPHTTAALGEGSHTFDVRATDVAGNTDATPASQTWTIDLTAPNTSIDSAPPALDGDATPTFAFSSADTGATFECRIDGGSWTPCTSPHTTAALTDGGHTFDVRAVDAAGNDDATPASHTWSIDLGPPSVTITSPTTYINAADPSTYTVTTTSPDGDIDHVNFYECSNASIDCATGSWTQFDSDNAAPFSGSWSTPGTDGARAIRAVAVDAALNTGADVRTITIDRTAPSGVTISYANGYAFGSVPVTTDSGPDADVNPSTATFERHTGDLANDACTSYGGWTAVTSPDTVASSKCAQYRFRVADDAGNWSTASSSNEVKSDTDAPTSAQDDPGANLRGTVTLTTSAGDTGGSGLASVAFQRRPAGGGSWTTIATDMTSPFGTPFDTTAGTDGLYDFRTVATDVAGNSEASPVVVANRRIDNTAPSATMLSPGNPIRGTVALTSNTSDGGSGIDTITYELAPNGGSFNTQPASWDTTLGADGLYDLRVTATDIAGNSTTSPLLTTRVDNTAPALTFSSPSTGSTASGTVALTATASDASPAAPPISFAYKLHTDPPSAYTATGASWNTSALPGGDGLYDLRARATDDANNTTTVENTSIRVDNVAPTVAITAPATAINGSLPSPTSLSATASDPGGSGVAQVQFFECSNQSNDCATGIWSPLGTVAAPGPYSVSWSIPAADGNHALAAVATDNAGHPSSDIRNVDVDRTAPETTIAGKPANPSNTTSPVFTFGSSESGSTFECRIDGGSWAPCTSPHTLNGLTDNDHTFDARATDAAGNTDASPDTWTWHRDTNNPNATINHPGANVRQAITLTSTENDPPSSGYASGLASVTFEYSSDGTTWATIGTNNSPPLNDILWNTTGVADGVYQLRIVVYDVAGNSTASTPVTNVRIDNTAPTTSQNDPGQYLRATKTLTGSAADSGSGIDHVDFERAPTGGGSWTTIATDSTPGDGFQASFDTTGVSDGHYDLRTVAYDVAGNQAAAAAVTGRLVDNTAPNASLNDPGAYLRGAVSLTSNTGDPGGANASGVVNVAYEYSSNGGGTWQPTGSTFDSTSVADGNVDLHVVATDAAGNTTASSALTKLVDNTKPSTSDNAPGGWHVERGDRDALAVRRWLGRERHRVQRRRQPDVHGRYQRRDPGTRERFQRRRAHDRVLLGRQRRQHRDCQEHDGADRRDAAGLPVLRRRRLPPRQRHAERKPRSRRLRDQVGCVRVRRCGRLELDADRHRHNRPGAVHGRLGHHRRAGRPLRPAHPHHRQRGQRHDHSAAGQGRRQHESGRRHRRCANRGPGRHRHRRNHRVGLRRDLADRLGRVLHPRLVRRDGHDGAVRNELEHDRWPRRLGHHPDRRHRHGGQLDDVDAAQRHGRQRLADSDARRPRPEPERHGLADRVLGCRHDAGRLRAPSRRRRLVGDDRQRLDAPVGDVPRHHDARGRSL